MNLDHEDIQVLSIGTILGLIVILAIVYGCGSAKLRNPAEPEAAECSLVGRILTCGNSSITIADGVDGQDGESITGATGERGETGSQGEQGPAGQDGEDGQDGIDGADGSDGADGQDGSDGIDATPVTVVTPCASTATAHSEQFLCIDNSLYAVYVGSGNQIRLSRLSTGYNYVTTDGRNCHFSIIEGCEVSQ